MPGASKVAPVRSPAVTTSTAAATKAAKRRHCVPKCCAPFCTFFVFGLIFVPLAVFCISAIFALPLWAVECGEVENYTPSAWSDEDNICSFFQWWIYIIGNLVGVSITNVAPAAGHVFSEILDLLICVWSLTVAGLVIGLVGSLAWVNFLVENADSSLNSKFTSLMGLREKARELAADASGLDFDEFSQLCVEHSLSLPEERRRELFNSNDENGNGVIDSSEVEKLIAKMKESETVESVEPTTAQLVERMNAMDSKLDAILGLLASRPA